VFGVSEKHIAELPVCAAAQAGSGSDGAIRLRGAASNAHRSSILAAGGRKAEPTEWAGEDAAPELFPSRLVGPAFHSVRIVNGCPERFAMVRSIGLMAR